MELELKRESKIHTDTPGSYQLLRRLVKVGSILWNGGVEGDTAPWGSKPLPGAEVCSGCWKGYLNKVIAFEVRKGWAAKEPKALSLSRIKFCGGFLARSWSGSVVSETFSIQKSNTMTLPSPVFCSMLTPFYASSPLHQSTNIARCSQLPEPVKAQNGEMEGASYLSSVKFPETRTCVPWGPQR